MTSRGHGASRIGLFAVMAVAAGCGVFGSGGPADIIKATRIDPGTVSLSVASCNEDPFVAEVEQTSPGTYQVLVRTRLSSDGHDCSDRVTLHVDATHPTVVVVDRSSGQSFGLLGSGLPAPLGLNGVWRMTTVDRGHPVIIGQTTAEIPELTIRAGAESGVIEGMFGCNHLSIEVTFAADTITGRPDTLKGIRESCTIPEGSDQLTLTEQTLLELLSGEQASNVYLSGDHLELNLPYRTFAVFERISPLGLSDTP